MALNAREAYQMVQAAKKAKKKLMINFSFRFADHCIDLKNIIDRGDIGRIYYCRSIWHRLKGIPAPGSWFSKKSLSGGGPLIDIGVHRLDLALWLMGYPKAKTISASTFNHIGRKFGKKTGLEFTVEDLALAFIRLENDATLILETSWDAYSQRREDMITQIYGTKGGIVQRNVEGYKFEARIVTEEGGILRESLILDGYKKNTNSMQHFVDCILDNKEPISSGEQGYENMRIIDGIYMSAKKGKEIKIDN
jgi:predicted dehydrogenase